MITSQTVVISDMWPSDSPLLTPLDSGFGSLEVPMALSTGLS